MSNDKLMLMGATMAADGIKSFCRKVILNNHKKTVAGESPVPICIWGTHGIGKTAVVEAIAKENAQRVEKAEKRAQERLKRSKSQGFDR